MNYDEKLENLKQGDLKEGYFQEKYFCTEEDYYDWCRRGKLSFEEAALLCVGLNPYQSNDLDYVFNNSSNSKLLETAKKIRSILHMHYRSHYFQTMITMAQFITAARQSTIQVPQAFITSYDEYMKILHNNLKSYEDLVKENHALSKKIEQTSMEVKNKPNNNLYNTKQENEILKKLLFVLAQKHYGYIPKQRNKATGNNSDSITSLAQIKGIAITDDTLRKYLNKGSELLTDSNKEITSAKN